MNKICTSLEQSKKLIELGIDIDTADMFWKNGVCDKYIQCFTPFVSSGTNIDYDYDIPAWSLSTLLELIPTSIDEYTKDFSQLEITKCSVSYVYAMNNLRRGYLKDNLLDAAFEMVCWLKENGKI